MTVRAFLTVMMLCVSNVFMTFAWYGNLRLQQVWPKMKDWPLALVIVLSWAIALVEYCFSIPANRLGSQINGGPFSLMQLKVIQEAVSLTVFTLIVSVAFQSEPIRWNHLVALVLLVAAVFFAFLK